MAKKREHKETELELTTLINVMVVLISFLLLTAVFTQITIQELKLPAQAGGGDTPLKPPIVVEVIVRKSALQISNGKSVTETIANVGNKFDYKKLSESLLQIKRENQEKDDASVLMEPDIEYETLIAVMDAIKGAEIYTPGKDRPRRVILFPQVSIGDAP